MDKKEDKNGVSLFGQSEFLTEGSDPLEEIFALNLGDFVSEHLISKDLAEKIGAKNKDKRTGLKKQLNELIAIYSSQKTLCVLSFDKLGEESSFISVANTIKQMIEAEDCAIYLSKDSKMSLIGSTSKDFVESVAIDFEDKDFIFNNGITYVAMRANSDISGIIAIKSSKLIQKEYLKLSVCIAQLFATSLLLQNRIDDTNSILNMEDAGITELQHLRAELTALIGDLCEYQQNFVEELAKAVDTKGQYKVSHSQNTANLAKLICTELGLNEKTKDLIYYAGLLQNIGKISLPESIFATNGKLSDEEFKKIQNHITTGVNMLMNINFLSEVVPYITYQTEHYDGTGKPEGLKGQSIPLGSRIIAVADVFCAMTSDRPYRKALQPQEAIEIMSNDTKWDPVVISALKQIVK